MSTDPQHNTDPAQAGAAAGKTAKTTAGKTANTNSGTAGTTAAQAAVEPRDTPPPGGIRHKGPLELRRKAAQNLVDWARTGRPTYVVVEGR